MILVYKVFSSEIKHSVHNDYSPYFFAMAAPLFSALHAGSCGNLSIFFSAERYLPPAERAAVTYEEDPSYRTDRKAGITRIYIRAKRNDQATPTFSIKVLLFIKKGTYYTTRLLHILSAMNDYCCTICQ